MTKTDARYLTKCIGGDHSHEKHIFISADSIVIDWRVQVLPEILAGGKQW